MKAEVVTKVQVASRQLREAIFLFFEKRDAIAIHTIVASAHQVLVDIGKRMGVQSAVKNTAVLKSDEVREKTFWCWFVSAHRELFDDLPSDGEIARLQSLEIGKWSFAEIVAFLKFAEIAHDAGT